MSEHIRATGTPRAREAAPAYGGAVSAAGFAVTVSDRGRLVLPAEVRQQLHIADGDTLTLVIERDGGIRLLTAAAYARRLRGMFKHLATPGRSMVDELIAERRREAAAEERHARASAPSRRTRKKR